MLRGQNQWVLTLGVMLIIAGIAAILFPFISTLGVTCCVAWMLIAASIIQSVNAFSQQGWDKIVLGLLVAALWLVGAVFLLMRPLEGVFVLTIIVAGIFVAEGVIKTILAFQMRPQSGWGWILFDAIAAIALGILLWWQLPLSAIWALGTLAGINIMISGWTLVMVPKAIIRAMDEMSKS